jgi:hypothetical protein
MEEEFSCNFRIAPLLSFFQVGEKHTPAAVNRANRYIILQQAVDLPLPPRESLKGNEVGSSVARKAQNDYYERGMIIMVTLFSLNEFSHFSML